MNKNGQMMIGLAMIMVAFIGVIVGLALYTGGIAPSLGTATQTTNINESITAPAVNVTSPITGQAIIGTPLALNDSGDDVTSEFTFASNQVVNGELTATIASDDDSVNAGNTLQLSYEAEPLGYIQDSGTRSVALLIAIFTTLAIALVVLFSLRNNGFLDLFKS